METQEPFDNPAVATAPAIRFDLVDGQVIAERGGTRVSLGPVDDVGEVMCDFLAAIDFGECQASDETA
jgi:hypothetical protein